MMRKIIYSILLLFSVVFGRSESNESLHLKVEESSGSSLPFAFIKVEDKLNKVTDENGELLLEKKNLNISDTLIVEYIGFHTQKIILIPDILKKKSLQIILKERTYNLDEVVVNPSRFNAHKFFRKSLHSSALAYNGRLKADLDISYGKNFSKKISTQFTRFKRKIEIDSTKLSKEELTLPFLSFLPNIIYNGVSFAGIFCWERYRKKFDCSYIGKKGKYKVWEFELRKDEEKSLIKKNDDFKITCLISLSPKGNIHNIRCFLTEHEDASSVALYDIEYTLFKREFIAQKIHFTNYTKGEKDCDIKLNFRNFRKKDEEVIDFTQFDAHQFFRKSLHSFALAYSGRFNADLDVLYGKNFSKKISTLFSRYKGKVKIDSTRLSKKELALPFINSLSEVIANGVNLAEIFCWEKYRKKFDCSYIGKEDGYKTWKFKLKSENEKLPISKPTGFDMICLVVLDYDGNICNVKCSLVDKNDKFSVISYDVEYTLFKREFIADNIHFTNYTKGEKDCDIKLNFQNFRKKD